MDLKRRLRDGRHGLWLRLTRRGNEDAFRRLYWELYGPVAGYVAARTGNVHDAEDLTSTVFHRFLERLDRFETNRGSVMTWILAMARNAVIDHYRRLEAHGAARKRAVPVEELADVLACANLVISRSGANMLYELIALKKQYNYALITIGQVGSSSIRQKIFNHLKK